MSASSTCGNTGESVKHVADYMYRTIIIDYLPPKRVPKTRALFWWGLRAATVVVGIGLYEFETNDVGLTEGIKRIWKA
jgi:succinate dehydrogenase (ubiquinone) membrane anchor subunit